MNRHYIIPIFVPHRGCPHDCVFCNQKKITGMGDTGDITAIDVKTTIEEYLKTINKKNKEAFIEVSFFGGSFTGISMDYQKELLREAKIAKDQGRINAIRLSTRPDYINEAILDNLREYGVDIIELGVQSMSEEVLLASERGHTSDIVRKATKLIKEYDFKLGLQMMIGLPMDTPALDSYTASQIIGLGPDFVRIYPSLIIRETYLEEMFLKGDYTPLSVDEAVVISKQLYRMFITENIPIIRLGLQPTDSISMGKDVVGGPFHPAFRELVEGSLINDMIAHMMKDGFSESSEIIIEINPKEISKLFADKKRYFNSLKSNFSNKKIDVRQNSMVELGAVGITVPGVYRKMSLYEFLKLEK